MIIPSPLINPWFKMNACKRYVFCIAMGYIVLLCSCSALLGPVKIHHETLYTMNTLPTLAHQDCSHDTMNDKQQKNRTLLVLPPSVNGVIYNNTHIPLLINNNKIIYTQKYRWADTPVTLLQSLMLQTLHQALCLKAVVFPPFIGQYDYILNTQLLELQLKNMQKIQSVEFILQAQFIQSKTNRVIAAKQFHIIQCFTGHTSDDKIKAINQTIALFLKQLAYFCIQIFHSK